MTHHQSGFTILEVLLVMAMGVLLISLTLPVGLRFYQVHIAETTTEELIATYRRAVSAARLGKNNQPFGVKLFADHFVLFEGGTYASRVASQDQTTAFPLGATMTTRSDEIVFAPVTGLPSATGTVTLSLYGKTHAIEITDMGLVTQRD